MYVSLVCISVYYLIVDFMFLWVCLVMLVVCYGDVKMWGKKCYWRKCLYMLRFNDFVIYLDFIILFFDKVFFVFF